MPELPEVETIRRELDPLVTGRRINSVTVHRPDIVGWPSAGEFSRRLKGRHIAGTDRRGKYLVFRLAQENGSEAGELVVHLRLSGHLLVRPTRSKPPCYERCGFHLSGGRILSLVEPRALGRVYFVSGGNYPPNLNGMLKMGPEPVSPGFSARFLAERLAGRRAPVKTLLLDQRVCCGVGNIYSDEALFRAGVRPDRPAGSLSAAEVRRLAAELRRVIRAGIRWCGTTLDDGRYRRPDSRSGAFQRRLFAYGRAGEACRRRGCPGRIVRLRLGNRGSCYCPVCQPGMTGGE